MSGHPTPLQMVWVEMTETILLARHLLDEQSFGEFVELAVVAARLNAERIEREWRRAA